MSPQLSGKSDKSEGVLSAADDSGLHISTSRDVRASAGRKAQDSNQGHDAVTFKEMEKLLQKHHGSMMLQLNAWKLHQEQLIMGLMGGRFPQMHHASPFHMPPMPTAPTGPPTPHFNPDMQLESEIAENSHEVADTTTRSHSHQQGSANGRAVSGISQLESLSKALQKNATTSSEDSITRKDRASAKVAAMPIRPSFTKEKTMLERVVESDKFEMAVAAAIATNSIVIGIEVDYMTRHESENSPLPFFLLQHVYTVFFLVELFMRLCRWGWGFFTNTNWSWNTLDFIVVVSSAIEAALDVVYRSHGIQAVSGISNIRVVRIIRIARLIRIMRVARLLRFFRALQTLVYSIFCTLMSVFWAMFLLCLLIYIFAIIFTQYTSFYLADMMLIPSNCSLEVCRLEANQGCCDLLALEKYWSSLPRSMFTCFKTITGGVSWHEVVEPLGGVSWVCVGLFTCYVSFAYFAVLNVVTGVFCHSAIESAQLQKDLMIHATIANNESYVDRVKNLFKDLDSDDSGYITINEFEEHLKDEAVRAYFASLELDTSDAWTLWKLLDSDGSHCIEADEFVMGCLRLRGNAKSIDLAKLMLDTRKILLKLNNFFLAIEDIAGVAGIPMDNGFTAKAAGADLADKSSSSTKSEMFRAATSVQSQIALQRLRHMQLASFDPDNWQRAAANATAAMAGVHEDGTISPAPSIPRMGGHGMSRGMSSGLSGLALPSLDEQYQATQGGFGPKGSAGSVRSVGTFGARGSRGSARSSLSRNERMMVMTASGTQ